MTLSNRIKTRACELEFDLVGIAPAGRAQHAAEFSAWLDQGYHADMAWLSRNPERRLDVRNVLPGAKSVVAVGFSYFVENPPAAIWNDPSRGRIARFAWGPDYHNILTPRLKDLAVFIGKETKARTKVYIDTGPVLEHDIAWRAGLGFSGKNSLLINPAGGSHYFLGVIITDEELDYDDPLPDSGAASCGK